MPHWQRVLLQLSVLDVEVDWFPLSVTVRVTVGCERREKVEEADGPLAVEGEPPEKAHE